MTRGRLRDPEATGEAFRHGWFHSGDVGRFGPDGVLWFTDRSKDVIKRGGENVASLEVEPAVYDAARTSPRSWWSGVRTSGGARRSLRW
ncbi:MAG: AMP-binding protein [Pseudonocardia sp.]|nr:AMP-binding protein [Pseudonocardia sp.]